MNYVGVCIISKSTKSSVYIKLNSIEIHQSNTKIRLEISLHPLHVHKIHNVCQNGFRMDCGFQLKCKCEIQYLAS